MSDANHPLMPKATAVWLVDNTGLTFEQIAAFCGLHMLEVKGIADGDVAAGIRGKDPITGGELSRDEIRKGEADADYELKISKSTVKLPPMKTKKAARYTPTSRRQDRPNAILWLAKNHPELKDSQIIKLVGTTKPTITQIRERTHWNSQNLVPQDPVALGLCSQTDLDAEVAKGAARVRKELAASGEPLPSAGTLEPTADTTGYQPVDPASLNVDPTGGDQPDFGAFGGGARETPADAATVFGAGATTDASTDDTAERESEEDARMLESLKNLSSPAQPDEEPAPDADDVFSRNDEDADKDDEAKSAS